MIAIKETLSVNHPLSTRNLGAEISLKPVASAEHKMKHGYNVLGEVEIFLQALQKGTVTSQAKDYVLENELTAACEAVDSGGGTWSNYRPWDSEKGHFLAFGRPFIGMLQAGVDAMRSRVEKSPELSFELRRREAELDNEVSIVEDYQKGLLRNRTLLTVSPYPEEISEEVAASVGYKPKERLGKLRFEVFTEGVRQTIELSIARGSMRIYEKLIESLGGKVEDQKDSASFLKTRIDLGASKDYLGVIANTANKYNSLLRPKGKTIDPQELIERQRWVRSKGKDLVGSLTDKDLELAQSLYEGTPTPKTMDSMKYWLRATDSRGARMLSQEEWGELLKAVDNNSFTREVATILKKNELIRMWSVMACVLNEESAKKLFGSQQVAWVRNMASKGIPMILAGGFLDRMIAKAKPTFIPCGGSLSFGKSTGAGLFGASLGTVSSILFKKNENEWFVCPDPKCAYRATGPIGNGGCPGCDITKEKAREKGLATC